MGALRARSCALGERGYAVVAWGSNVSGQCGVGGDHAIVARPTPLRDLDGVRVKSVSASRSHSALVTEDGDAFAWGSGDDGQLGLGGSADARRPERLEALVGRADVAALALGPRHSTVVARDGSVWVAGGGAFRGAAARGLEAAAAGFEESERAYEARRRRIRARELLALEELRWGGRGASAPTGAPAAGDAAGAGKAAGLGVGSAGGTPAPPVYPSPSNDATLRDFFRRAPGPASASAAAAAAARAGAELAAVSAAAASASVGQAGGEPWQHQYLLPFVDHGTRLRELAEARGLYDEALAARLATRSAAARLASLDPTGGDAEAASRLAGSEVSRVADPGLAGIRRAAVCDGLSVFVTRGGDARTVGAGDWDFSPTRGGGGGAEPGDGLLPGARTRAAPAFAAPRLSPRPSGDPPLPAASSASGSGRGPRSPRPAAAPSPTAIPPPTLSEGWGSDGFETAQGSIRPRLIAPPEDEEDSAARAAAPKLDEALVEELLSLNEALRAPQPDTPRTAALTASSRAHPVRSEALRRLLEEQQGARTLLGTAADGAETGGGPEGEGHRADDDPRAWPPPGAWFEGDDEGAPEGAGAADPAAEPLPPPFLLATPPGAARARAAPAAAREAIRSGGGALLPLASECAAGVLTQDGKLVLWMPSLRGTGGRPGASALAPADRSRPALAEVDPPEAAPAGDDAQTRPRGPAVPGVGPSQAAVEGLAASLAPTLDAMSPPADALEVAPPSGPGARRPASPRRPRAAAEPPSRAARSLRGLRGASRPPRGVRLVESDGATVAVIEGLPPLKHAVAAGGRILATNGRDVWCVGTDAAASRAREEAGLASESWLRPARVFRGVEGGPRVTKLAASVDAAAFVTDDGGLYLWGTLLDRAFLGLAAASDPGAADWEGHGSDEPTRVGGLGYVEDVALGAHHAIAVIRA